MCLILYHKLILIKIKIMNFSKKNQILIKMNKYSVSKNIIILVAVALLSFTNSYSQESTKESTKETNNGFKGAWWGLAAASYTDSEATDTQSFTILPAVGVFIAPTVTVGGALGYTSTKVGNADALDIIIVKPLVRKYFGISDKFFLFAEANVPLLINENFTGYGFNIEPGIDYFIGGKWTIEAKFGRFGYNAIKHDGGDTNGTTSLGFNMFDSQTQEGLGSGLSFGLKYLF